MTSNLVNFHASIRKSENLLFNRLTLFEAYKFWWKSTEELCLMRKNWPRGSKNGIRSLVNFYVSSGKSENLHFVLLFLLKLFSVWVKKSRGVIWRNTEVWWKNWGVTDLSFEKWHGKFAELHRNTQKS